MTTLSWKNPIEIFSEVKVYVSLQGIKIWRGGQDCKQVLQGSSSSGTAVRFGTCCSPGCEQSSRHKPPGSGLLVLLPASLHHRVIHICFLWQMLDDSSWESCLVWSVTAFCPPLSIILALQRKWGFDAAVCPILDGLPFLEWWCIHSWDRAQKPFARKMCGDCVTAHTVL